MPTLKLVAVVTLTGDYEKLCELAKEHDQPIPTIEQCIEALREDLGGGGGEWEPFEATILVTGEIIDG